MVVGRWCHCAGKTVSWWPLSSNYRPEISVVTLNTLKWPTQNRKRILQRAYPHLFALYVMLCYAMLCYVLFRYDFCCVVFVLLSAYTYRNHWPQAPWDNQPAQAVPTRCQKPSKSSLDSKNLGSQAPSSTHLAAQGARQRRRAAEKSQLLHGEMVASL